jgi:hypothetical protein
MSELDDFAAIVRSELFDRKWYLAAHPDVAGAKLDPLLHYFRFGAAEGRPPNAYFDPVWYRAQAGLADCDEPLLHYIQTGEAAGIPPNELFDPAWYRAAYGLDPDASVLADFLAHRADRLPSPSLYAVRSLPEYADGAADEPVADYISRLTRSGASPDCDQLVIAAADVFDCNHYLINGSDVLERSLDPLEHFCRFGWREGRDPNVYFNTRWYLRTNPAVRRLGINPLVHYILEGEKAGRRPVVYFDPIWYRNRYGVPPGAVALSHFLQRRRNQNLSPNSLFDEAWYLDRYRNLVGPGRDPFAHFLQAGTYRDLDPSPHFDAAAYRRSTLGRPSRHFRRTFHPDTHNPLIHHLHSTYR